MEINTDAAKPVVLKIFDFINNGFNFFYDSFMKICPEFIKEYLAVYSHMAYVFYGFLLFLGIALAYKMRKKIFLIISLIAIFLIAAKFLL